MPLSSNLFRREYFPPEYEMFPVNSKSVARVCPILNLLQEKPLLFYKCSGLLYWYLAVMQLQAFLCLLTQEKKETDMGSTHDTKESP